MTVNIANISVGLGPDTHTGEPMRSAFIKVNNNFANLKTVVDSFTSNTTTGNLSISAQTISGTLADSNIVIDPLGVGELEVAGNLKTSFLTFRGNTIGTQYVGDLVLNASAGNIRLADPLKFADGTIQNSAAVGNGSVIQEMTINSFTSALSNIVTLNGHTANYTVYNFANGNPILGNIANVGFTGEYSDLLNVPTDISVFNNDAGYITIEAISTDISAFNNDAGYITGAYVTWANVDGKPTFATVATSGSYTDLSGAPTNLSAFTNDSGYITSSAIPTDISAFNNDTGFITSGDIPANISAFTNDSGYITTATANVISVNGQTGIVTLDLNTYGNANVADYLANFDGSINFTASPAIISGLGIVESAVANVTTVNATGNVTAGYFIGNGSQLTGLPASYTNSNVVTLLSSFGSNTIVTTGNVTASKFIGDGSGLTNVNVSVAGNIVGTQPNVTLVAGSYNYVFDNTGNATIPGELKGDILVSSNSSGDEGGEINLANPAANTSLGGTSVTVDIYRNQLRIFEGGSAKGVYVDLNDAPAGVGGQISYKASGFVDAGTFVQLDNIKASVTTSGNHGLSLATVSGTIGVNLSGNYNTAGGNGGSAFNNGSLTTSASSSQFNWNFVAEGDTSTYILTDKTNGKCYRITLMIGPAYLNNMICIERIA